MSDFETDYQFMMQNEDRSQVHAIVPDAPPGAHAISGINSAAYPKQFAAIASLPQAERGPAVEQFYRTEFFGKYQAQLSDPVAERWLDQAVNGGPVTATRLLQQAVGTVPVDGTWGSATVTACNAADQLALVTAFQAARRQHYLDIVAKHPEDAQYLPGWLARAAK